MNPMEAKKKILLFLMLAAVLAGFFYWLLAPARRSDLLGLAAGRASEMNLPFAEDLYERALDLDEKNTEARLAAVEYYHSSGNYTKMEYYLAAGLAAEPTNADYYRLLCGVFVEQGKLFDAVELLNGIPDPVILNKLNDIRPSPPEILPPTGTYRSTPEISISSDEGSVIYYSIDGNFPTIHSPYTDPIHPDPGTTQVLAVAVNAQGLVSQPSEAQIAYQPEEAAVAFADPGFEQIVRVILNNSERAVSSVALRGITDFSNTIETMAIELNSLEDLKWLTGLESLSLQGYSGSLEPLSTLQVLNALSLTSCDVGTEDLKYLSGLERLTYLDLSDNLIASFEPLAGLEHLTYLNLRNNAVVDLEPLSKMARLETLDLGQNAIQSAGPVSGCTLLTELYLDHNKLTDVRALSSLKDLQSLDLSYNALRDLLGMETLGLLQTLGLSNNEIEILTPLSGCINLRSLDLSRNNITVIDPLAPLVLLTNLNLSVNTIGQIDALSGYSALQTLDLSKNFITDVTPLSKLPELTTLNIENNLLKTVSSLAHCVQLTTVYAFGNTITSIKALEDAGIVIYK